MRDRFRAPPQRVLPPTPADLAVDRNESRVLLACPLLPGRFLTTDDPGYTTDAIVFSAGVERELPHGLGRQWRWFGACPLTAVEARLYPVASTDETKTITIHPVTSCTCRIWIC